MEMRDLIKRRRIALKMTQAELAQKMDIGHATIGRYENGVTPLNENAIKKFSDALGIDLQAEYFRTQVQELVEENTKLKPNLEKGLVVHLCDSYDMQYENQEECPEGYTPLAIIHKNGNQYIVEEEKINALVSRFFKHMEIEFDAFLEDVDEMDIIPESDRYILAWELNPKEV